MAHCEHTTENNMKHKNLLACKGWALALACLLTSPVRAAISVTDIQIWAGSGPHQAALVIDWADGSPALLWGYRWADGANPTGNDLLRAIMGVDSRLRVPGLDAATNFISAMEYDADGNGIYERSQTSALGPYWGYTVNNEVYYDPVDFHLNSHLLPPNGNPYDGGAWVDSSTGILDRPLADSSWDGFAFGDFSFTTFTGPQPAAPVAALSVPEPVNLWRLVVCALIVRRRRA